MVTLWNLALEKISEFSNRKLDKGSLGVEPIWLFLVSNDTFWWVLKPFESALRSKKKLTRLNGYWHYIMWYWHTFCIRSCFNIAPHLFTFFAKNWKKESEEKEALKLRQNTKPFCCSLTKLYLVSCINIKVCMYCCALESVKTLMVSSKPIKCAYLIKRCFFLFTLTFHSTDLISFTNVFKQNRSIDSFKFTQKGQIVAGKLSM